MSSPGKGKVIFECLFHLDYLFQIFITMDQIFNLGFSGNLELKVKGVQDLLLQDQILLNREEKQH